MRKEINIKFNNISHLKTACNTLRTIDAISIFNHSESFPRDRKRTFSKVLVESLEKTTKFIKRKSFL
jgi:hypothetical protein